MVEIGQITPTRQFYPKRHAKKVSGKIPVGREHEQRDDNHRDKEQEQTRDEKPHFDGYA